MEQGSWQLWIKFLKKRIRYVDGMKSISAIAFFFLTFWSFQASRRFDFLLWSCERQRSKKCNQGRKLYFFLTRINTRNPLRLQVAIKCCSLIMLFSLSMSFLLNFKMIKSVDYLLEELGKVSIGKSSVAER